MGIDAADFDNSGWPSLFIDALANQRYWLFRNRNGSFEHAASSTGIGEITNRYSGWGARFLDWDNDGRIDIVIAQGHVMDNIELTQPGLRYREAPLLLRNTGRSFEAAA